MPGARAVFSRGQRWALLTLFALLLMFRIPLAWAHGRFVDEEATVFLSYAWHRPWLDALFRPFAGYWNVGANGITVLIVGLVKGGILPLERAPYVTMTAALSVQLLPAVLILTGRASWLSHRSAVLAALLTVAIAPATEEVFFNVLHIQFHLALCAALILALDTPRGRFARFGYTMILVGGPLCGPGAIVLLPLFVLRALVDRDRSRIEQIVALATGAAIQMLLFYGPNPMRSGTLDPTVVGAAMFARLIALPTLGFRYAYAIGIGIYEMRAAGNRAWLWPIAPVIILFSVLILQATRRRDAAVWLVLSGLLIATVSLSFGIIIVTDASPFDLASERYDFIPIVTLGWAMIAMAARPNFPGRLVYGALCLLLLFNGALDYRQPRIDLASGPSWPAEVAAWRHDHRHLLGVWPEPYAADLSDTSRPCSPIGRNPGQSSDPRYCESGWVASFPRHWSLPHTVNRLQ